MTTIKTFAAALLAATAIVSTAQAPGYQSPLYPKAYKDSADEAFRRQQQTKEEAARRFKESEERRQIEEKEKAARDAAERQRQAEDLQRKLDDAKARQAEEDRQQRLPVNRMVNAYAAYIFVRVCHESRDGYLVQYVNDAEMERAEKAVRAAVDKLMTEDPSIDKARAWDDARAYARGTKIAASIEFCQMQLGKLYSLSPVAPYQFGRPE
ncbi:flagellar biosynthesis GTPase FlhF [Bradyrhizobium barranii subsp. barranii]|uniref:hypothetical protein n=1 Tax=Bradyrhizobium liaoningense TaxID=43992 RepID=UPI001BA76647|nr:hypothetical protein [Bradyrhizobium liaoningense]MBR0879129.1 hypothetical protein [Bradyrhizobium liaoningense]